MKFPFMVSKTRYRFIGFIAFLTLVACEEQEQMKAKFESLNVVVSEDYIEANESYWVYTSGEDGDVLEIHEFTGPDEVFFSKKNGVVDVTIAQISVVNSVYQYAFKTYKNVVGKKQLQLQNKEYQLPPTGGTSGTLRLKNFPSVSGEHPVHFSPERQMYSYMWPGPDDTKEFTFDLGTTNDVLLIGYRSGKPVYFTKTINEDDVLLVDFESDFVENKNRVTFENFPEESTGAVMGSHNNDYLRAFSDDFNLVAVQNLGDVYVLDATALASQQSTPSFPKAIGYIEGFQNYFTTVSGAAGNERIEYNRLGSPATLISAPQYDINLSGQSVSAFNVDFTAPYTYKHVDWRASNLWWRVSSDSENDGRIKSIPSAIKAKHPELDLEHFTLSEISFVMHQDNYSFDNYLDDIFCQNIRTAFEFYKVTKTIE